MIYDRSNWEELLENKGFVGPRLGESVNEILKKVYKDPNCELELWSFIKGFNFDVPESRLGDSYPNLFLPLIKILYHAYKAKKARVKVAAGSNQAQYPSTGGGGGWSDDFPPNNFGGGGGDRWGGFSSQPAPQPPKNGLSVWQQLFWGVVILVVASIVTKVVWNWVFVADPMDLGPRTEIVVITATPVATPIPESSISLPVVASPEVPAESGKTFSFSSQKAVDVFLVATKGFKSPFLDKMAFEADGQEISLQGWFGSNAFGPAKGALISFAGALLTNPPDLEAAQLALDQARKLEPELNLEGLEKFVDRVEVALAVPPTATPAPTVLPTATPVLPTAVAPPPTVSMVEVAKTAQVVVAPTLTPAQAIIGGVIPAENPTPIPTVFSTATLAPILPTPVGTVGLMSLAPVLPTSVGTVVSMSLAPAVINFPGGKAEFLSFLYDRAQWGKGACVVVGRLITCPDGFDTNGNQSEIVFSVEFTLGDGGVQVSTNCAPEDLPIDKDGGKICFMHFGAAP